MYKKMIKYTDYNGVEREEPFYFNLNKAEIAEMQLTAEGGLNEYIQRIIDTDDRPKLVELFKRLILKAYGVKSDDGKRFIKKENGRLLSEDFEQTEAYAELFMQLASDADAAADFVNGLTPKDNSTSPIPFQSVQ